MANEEKTETKATEKKAAPKKEKAKKEPPKRNFVNSDYSGRKVFTPKGVGHIVQEDRTKGAERFLVKIGDAEHDMSAKSVRFKAVDDSYRENYEVDKGVRTLSGAPSISCGDVIARAMKGLVEVELGTVAEENGLTENWLKWGQNGLNPGQRRMNLGNMLRTRYKKSLEEGSDVKAPTIFGKTPEKAADDRDAQLAKEREEAEKAEAKKKAEREKAKAAKAKKQKDAKKAA